MEIKSVSEQLDFVKSCCCESWAPSMINSLKLSIKLADEREKEIACLYRRLDHANQKVEELEFDGATSLKWFGKLFFLITKFYKKLSFVR